MTAPQTHDSYLAALPAAQRAALVALSARLLPRLPAVEPCISYAMPAWRLAGRSGAKNVVAGVAAFKAHLGYYPFSGSVVPQIAARLAAAGFQTSTSGVRFTAEHPLPDWALDALIRLRLAEIG